MKIHPRHWIVLEASADIATALTEAIKRHDLTHAELTGVLTQQIIAWNKYAVRDERVEEAPAAAPEPDCSERLRAQEERFREELRREHSRQQYFEVLRGCDGSLIQERLSVVKVERQPLRHGSQDFDLVRITVA